MSYQVGQFTVSAGVPYPVDIQANGLNKLVMCNESQLTIRVSFPGTTVSATLQAQCIDCFTVPPGANGVVILTPNQVLQVLSGTAPASSVIIDAYQLGEEPTGTYPVALNRVNNIGNSVPVTGISSTNVQNDGNAINTKVLEATQVSAPSSNAVIENSGYALLAELFGGAMLNLVQVIPGQAIAIILGAAGYRNVEVASALLLSSGSLGVTSYADLIDATGTDRFIKSGSGALWLVGFGGVEAGFDASGNFTVPNLKFAPRGILQFADGSHLSSMHAVSGSGSGTFSHHCPTTPSGIVITANSTSAAGYCSVYNITSTQFSVQVSSGGLAWSGYAITNT